jgi:hypothetical protein
MELAKEIPILVDGAKGFRVESLNPVLCQSCIAFLAAYELPAL